MLKPARDNKPMGEDHRADHVSAGENAGRRRRKNYEEETKITTYLYGQPILKGEDLVRITSSLNEITFK